MAAEPTAVAAPGRPPGGEEFDEHGFALPPEGDRLGDSSRAFARWFQPKAVRRLARFEGARKRLKGGSGSWATLPSAALKAILRKGVPPQHRREVWSSVLGCVERQRFAPKTYASLLASARAGLPVRTLGSIESDLKRTFPNHRRFATQEGQAVLRNVLLALAQHSPRVLYCQGLNFIAAVMLTVFKEEEPAFWALVCAIDVLDAERYYSDGTVLLRADMHTLRTLLERKCPAVARIFRELNVDMVAIAYGWFNTWFSKCMPIMTTLRIWDTLFFEGFKVLFRIAVAVFKQAEPVILRCSCMEDVLEQAQDWPRHSVDHNKLLKTCFAGVPGLRRKDILAAREEALVRVDEEDRLVQQRREEYRAREAMQQRTW